jgi:hypothetical protein
MISIWRSPMLWNIVMAFLLIPVVGMAADFELFWDPNCSADSDLNGYFIYYLEESSVVLRSSDANEIYVSLSDNGFTPDAPSYLVSGLMDDVTYCFAVSAWYGYEESGISNEVCGVNGVYAPNPSFSGQSSNGSNGCFIDALK